MSRQGGKQKKKVFSQELYFSASAAIDWIILEIFYSLFLLHFVRVGIECQF